MPREEKSTRDDRRFFERHPDAEYDFLPTSVFDTVQENQRRKAQMKASIADYPVREQRGNHDDSDQT